MGVSPQSLILFLCGKFIMSEQKNQASRRPTLDFLHAPVVQLRVDALSVTLSKNWKRIITGQRCHVKIERCTVVYENGNKLKDVDRDKEPILVIFLCFRMSV